MELSEFPRPPADNGRGIHWSAGATLVGNNVIRARWLPELQALGMKWVKLMSTGGEGLARLLLEHEIMPVVRLGGEKSLPGPIDDPRHGGGYLNELKTYRDLGVHYFEVCNEPNLRSEWMDNCWPDQGLVETVMSDWIKSVEIVLGAGGLPGVPALAPGGEYDDVRFFREACRWLVDHDHTDLMRQGVWIAIHNYSLHRPWDYPEDDVNRYGTPVTPEEYNHHRWWNNQSWDQVNAERAAHTNPDQTIMGDSNGFRKFEQYHEIWKDHFGFEVPILSTEGGYTVTQPGDGFRDYRYPWIDFELHWRGTVRQYEYMMYEAPAYYFCTADWVLANRLLGNPAHWWESQAWYTGFYASQGVRHHLPTVDRVKAMPNEPRKPSDWAEASVIKGLVLNASGNRIRLCGPAPREQTADEGGRFEFTRLPAGVYSLEVDVLGTVEDSLTTTGRNLLRVAPIPGIDLPLWIGLIQENTSGPTLVGGMGSSIAVVAHGSEALAVSLSLGGFPITEAYTGSTKPELGPNACEIAPLRGGTYCLRVPALGVEMDVFVDGQGRAKVELRPTGPGGLVQRRGRVRGRILGAMGQVLVLLGEDARYEITLPADGTYDFGGLPAGTYRLELDGEIIAGDLEVDGTTPVDVPLITVPEGSWIAEEVSNTSGEHITGGHTSAILCTVEGNDNLEVVLSAGDLSIPAHTGQKGPFKCEFAPLRGGSYKVTPDGLGVAISVFVDGTGAAEVVFRQQR